MQGIGGVWSGTYEVRDGRPRLPVSFQAQFDVPQSNGAFTGVLESVRFGGICSAEQGVQMGRFVRFRIVLLGMPPQTIAFHGTLSEDDTTISGTLTVTERHNGTEQTRQGRWEARAAR